MRTLRATEFKATCLAVLDEVARTGEPVTILKRGRPVAEVVPLRPAGDRFPQDALAGSVDICGEVMGPVLPASAWDAERGRGA